MIMGLMMFTASHIWTRISRAIAVYPGDFDKDFYRKLLDKADVAVPAIEALMKAGVDRFNPWHWGVELCGSVEVTAPNYYPPNGARLAESDPLFEILNKLFGY